MIVPLIILCALIDTTHVTIKQKKKVLVVYSDHHGTVMHISLYAGHLTSTLPAAHLNHTCMLAISTGSLNSLPLDINNVIFASSF